MKNNKIVILIIILLLILVISGIILKTAKKETAAPKPSENVLVEEEFTEEKIINKNDKDTDTETQIETKQEENQGKTTVKLYKKQIHKPAVKTQLLKEEVQKTVDERTDIDSELLKKEPRAEVVVVDKEYKLRSSGKYIFK